MIPLAITSTAGWIRRLGGRRWNVLHKLIYLSAIGGVIHYWWLVKADISRPARYAVVVAILLAARVWFAYNARHASKSRANAAAPRVADAGASADRG
jgi:sulfoxide reductase heme-binding subunit YedZ